MSVKTDPAGRRSVQVEFEVPGTPEEVWQAIATGPGISSWFVPAQVEERGGKPVAMAYQFSPDMQIRGTLTAWDPPRTFTVEQDEAWGDSPKMATEWNVEARAGGVCLVRMVHSLFASTDDWDEQLEEVIGGWSGFLLNLRLYLTHFRGQRHSAIMQVRAPAALEEAQAWDALISAVGVKGLSIGQRWQTPVGSPMHSGVLEHVTENPFDALLRLDEPGPGIAALGAIACGDGRIEVAMNLYLYGDEADAAVARETPLWQAWLEQCVPKPVEQHKGE